MVEVNLAYDLLTQARNPVRWTVPGGKSSDLVAVMQRAVQLVSAHRSHYRPCM